MKNNLVFTFSTIILFASVARGQSCSDQFKDFASTLNSKGLEFYSFLDKKLDSVNLVGFGEDTHGTAEFTQMAVNLMIYLAEKHNYQIFFIENGFGETTYLNDYINDRATDAEKILKANISTWRYQTTEFVDLLNTLKEYNQKHPAKPIQLFGIEMHYPLQEAKKLNEYFSKCGLPTLSATFNKTLYQTVSENELGDLFLACQKAKKQYAEKKDLLIAKSSELEYKYAGLYLNILGQYITAVSQPNEQLKHDLRDIYMEINLSNVMALWGYERKAMVWAHNAHVGNWVSNGIVDVLGHQLKKKYGNYYFNLATQYGTGEYLAFPSNANEVGWKLLPQKREKIFESSFTNCLAGMASPNLFLDLKAIRKNPGLRCSVSEPLTLMSGAGAQNYGVETVSSLIGTAFDGIIYISKSTPIHLLE